MIRRIWMVCLLAALAAVLSNFGPRPAQACGECEYEDGLTHLCLPKGGCVLNQLNPVTQVQQAIGLAQALATGNVSQTTQALGNILLNSPGCLGCTTLAHNVVPNLSESQINQIAGEGFVTFLATGDPVLVVIDVAHNTATQQPIKSSSSGPAMPQPAQPTVRSPQTYSGLAECIVQYKDGTMYAGWKTPPTLTGADGIQHTIPNIDLVPGDILNLTARPCPEWNVPAQGQATITTASIKYADQSLKNGGPDVIKWFLYGPHV